MRLYIITNLVNGKMYVGITKKTLKMRLKGHFDDVSKGSSRALCNAIRKYGRANFGIVQVDSADDWESLCIAEKQLIGELKAAGFPCYNMTEGGDGVSGWSDEFREKMSKIMTGRKHTAEAIAKISAAGKGRKHSLETRKKMSETHTGKKLTAEHIEKMAAAKRGKKRPPRSAEHSAKIAAGLRRAWAKKRLAK